MYYILALACLGLNVYFTILQQKKRQQGGGKALRGQILPNLIPQIGFLIAADGIFPFFGPDVDNRTFIFRLIAALSIYIATTAATTLIYRRIAGSTGQ